MDWEVHKMKVNVFKIENNKVDDLIVELEEKLSQAESPEYRQRLNNVSNYRDQLAALSY